MQRNVAVATKYQVLSHCMYSVSHDLSLLFQSIASILRVVKVI
jgi:hypothetical protein